MMKFGIVFCGKCHSTFVDSGHQSISTLKCHDCDNEGEFVVGKLSLKSGSINTVDIIEKAQKEAGI